VSTSVSLSVYLQFAKIDPSQAGPMVGGCFAS
jgi:hypothetical protein